ncbi:MAG: hypothetical protein CMD03_03060 [Flavobacteriales bacterium]|nr:hypothetical protein [Flavobacteriales bacterium]
MKKNILLTFLFFYSTLFLAAQSLVVTGPVECFGDVNVAGHTIEHYLNVKNNSNNPIDVQCQKTIISTLPPELPSWGGPSYCFAGYCYGASQTGPSNIAVLNPGQEISYSNGDSDAFTGYYDAEGINGVYDVQYCFYDVNNSIDETCVIITYNITGVLASTDIIRKSSMSFFPNPASDYTMINYTPKKNYIFELVDVLGNKVKVLDLSNSGKENLYVGELSKGIYFGSFIHNDKLISIKKLVVK